MLVRIVGRPTVLSAMLQTTVLCIVHAQLGFSQQQIFVQFNRLGEGPKLTKHWPRLHMQLLQAAQLEFIVSLQQLYPQAHDEVCYG